MIRFPSDGFGQVIKFLERSGPTGEGDGGQAKWSVTS